MTSRNLTSADAAPHSRNGHGENAAPPNRPLPAIRRGRTRRTPADKAEQSPLDAQLKSAVRGGRQVMEQPTSWWAGTGLDMRRRQLGQDEDTLAAIKTIRDLDAQSSHAVWNFLRLINPGHDLLAYTTDAAGEEVLEAGPAQKKLDEWAKRVGRDYGGGLDQLHNVLGLILITGGAAVLEVEFNQTLTEMVDWHPCDPALFTFQTLSLEENGPIVQQLGQIVGGTWAAINEAQVFYQPLDPDVGDPYGRPPLLAAIQNVVWLSQLLSDVRAMAHQQGFPRLDVQVVWDAIQNAAPPQLRDDPQQFQQWATNQLNSIVTDYEDLAADDTFIHFDFVKVGMAGGASGSFDFGSLHAILQRRITMSLKALPITIGINESTSETHGSIQWQIQVAGIENFQKIIKRLIEKAANVCFKFYGLQAHAKVQYEAIRTVDRLMEAQSDYFDRRNAQFDVQMGWATNDEAAERIVGHEAVAKPNEQMGAPAALGAAPAGVPPDQQTGGTGNGPMGGGNVPYDYAQGVPEWWAKLQQKDQQQQQGDGTPLAAQANPEWAWQLMLNGSSPYEAPYESIPSSVTPRIRSTTALALLREAKQRSEDSATS